MLRSSRSAVALATTLMAFVATLAVVPASPAYAGQAGRKCETFYAQGNANTGWGFEICVKLEHSPETHSWRTNGSVSTRTAGIGNMELDVGLNVDGVSRTVDGQIGPPPSVSDETAWFRCSGRHQFSGYASARVRWPNGVLSQREVRYIAPRIIAGNC